MYNSENIRPRLKTRLSLLYLCKMYLTLYLLINGKMGYRIERSFLKWLAHVERREKEYLSERVYKSKFEVGKIGSSL